MRNIGKNDIMGLLVLATITLAMLACVDMVGLVDIRQFARDIMAQDLWSIIRGGM